MDRETRAVLKEREQAILAKLRDVRRNDRERELEKFVAKIANTQSKFAKEAKEILGDEE